MISKKSQKSPDFPSIFDMPQKKRIWKFKNYPEELTSEEGYWSWTPEGQVRWSQGEERDKTIQSEGAVLC